MTSTVSRTLSPFDSDEDPAPKLIVSAERRRAAVSKESRVRVEFSKNNVATVRPLSAGTLGIGRRPISSKVSVRSRISSISLFVMPSMDNKLLDGIEFIFLPSQDLLLLDSHLQSLICAWGDFSPHNQA